MNGKRAATKLDNAKLRTAVDVMQKKVNEINSKLVLIESTCRSIDGMVEDVAGLVRTLARDLDEQDSTMIWTAKKLTYAMGEPIEALIPLIPTVEKASAILELACKTTQNKRQ